MTTFDHISRVFAWFHGGVVEQKDVEVAGVSNRVYYVDDNDWGIAGQATAFTHILINLAQIEEESQLIHDYIYLHESGHKQWPWILQVLFTLGQMAYVSILILLIAALPIQLIIVFQQPTVELKLFVLLSIFIVYVTFIIVPLFVTWLDEGLAELYSITHLGQDRYHQVLEKKAQKDRGISSTIRKYVMYPPDQIVLAIARWQNIG